MKVYQELEIAGTHQELLGFMQLLKDRKLKKFVYNKSKSDAYVDCILTGISLGAEIVCSIRVLTGV